MVGVVSCFMEKPTTKHLKAVKGVLRYVKGIVDYGLVYSKGKNENIIYGYSNIDLAIDVNDRRSTWWYGILNQRESCHMGISEPMVCSPILIRSGVHSCDHGNLPSDMDMSSS